MALTAYQKALRKTEVNNLIGDPNAPVKMWGGPGYKETITPPATNIDLYNAGATAGATTPPPAAGETRTPPLPTAGVTTGATTGGAVPAQVKEAKARAAGIKAQQDQQRVLQQAQKNGDIKTVNQILQTQNAQMNPYQATLAAATAPTSTLGGRMEDGRYRLSDGRTFDTLQGAIDANAAGAGGNTAGKPMTNGTGFLAAEGNPGKITYGSVFGNRVTDAEGNTHWLDDDHGYFKSSNGYVYDTNAATDLELARHGLYRTELGGKTVVMPIPDNLAAGFALNWGKLEADHIQKTGSLPLTPDELYGPDEDDSGVYSGGVSGGSLPSAPNPAPTNYAPEYTIQTPSPNPPPVQTQPTTNPTNPTPTNPTVTPPGTPAAAAAAANVQGGSGGTTSVQTPEQVYLSQWDYENSPDWAGSSYQQQHDDALNEAQAMKWEGSPFDPLVEEYLNKYGEEWQPTEYQALRDDYAQKAADLRWNYDPNTDPVWQALQKQYRREGDRATKEALAQAAMRTGGLANSYAVTAASQAGDYYAAQLSDRLPQLYQNAYQRYLDEYSRLLGLSDAYGQFDTTEYGRWYDQQGKNLDLAKIYNDLSTQEYGKFQDEYNRKMEGADAYGKAYTTAYGEFLDDLDQWNKDRDFAYGINRDARADYENDRDFEEDVRRYGLDYALRSQAQNFDIWYKQQGLSMDQAKMVFDQWYKTQGLSMEYEQMVFDQWYKGQVLMQNQQEIDNDYAYKQGVLGQNQQEIDFDQGYKTTAYQDALAQTDKERADQQALERAQRYAALGNYGPLAELWGMTEDEVRRLFEGDSMDADEAYAGGGSTSPFDETEIPSGTTPKYTPPPGDNPPGDTPPEDTPPGDTPPDNAGNGRTWWNGRPMTDTAYDLQSRIAYGWAQKTLTKENVQRMVYDAARKGYIEDYEIPLLMRIIGVNIQGPPQQNPNVEGPIAQWTK